MQFSRAWLIKTGEQLAVVAAVAFVGALAAGGTTFNLSVVHAALLAAWGAGISFAQSVLAGLLNPAKAPPSALVTTAVVHRSQPAAPPPPGNPPVPAPAVKARPKPRARSAKT